MKIMINNNPNTRQVALFSALTATCLGLQLLPRPPNIEFTSMITFTVGVVFGSLVGAFLGAFVMFVNGFLSPWGLAGLNMPFQIAGMSIIGIVGGLFSKTQKLVVHVNIGINYGDGTPTRWFNQTRVRAGDSLLNATMLVEVRYTVTLGLGTFVDSIDNVANSGSFYWMWWMYTQSGWSLGQVSSDRYIVGDNEIYYWYYEDTSTWPPPSPPS